MKDSGYISVKEVILTAIIAIMGLAVFAQQNSAVFQSTFMQTQESVDDEWTEKWGYDSIFIIEEGKITHVMDHGTAEFYVFMTFVTANSSKVYQTVDMNNQPVTIYFEKRDPWGTSDEEYFITIDYSKAKRKHRPKKSNTRLRFWVHRD